MPFSKYTRVCSGKSTLITNPFHCKFFLERLKNPTHGWPLLDCMLAVAHGDVTTHIASSSW